VTSHLCEMCGTYFESFKLAPGKLPDCVCKPCADAFVKFIDDTILEDLDKEEGVT